MPTPPPPPPPAAPVPASVATTAPAAPRSAEAILRQALDDAGKIDKDLRKDMSNQIQEPPVDARLSKLRAGIEAATARPKAWEAPKIENVADQGGYDRRIYKITTAYSVYCIYNESNHAPDGLDSMKNGLHPKIMTCPREK